MKTIGIFMILFGLYYYNFGQTNTLPNNRFSFKPQDFQLNTENPYIQFHKNRQVTPWLENNPDWDFKSDKALPRNNLTGIRSFKKSDNAIPFAGSMPVLHPEILSNMSVLKPDSSTHYHMLIKKINQYRIPEAALR